MSTQVYAIEGLDHLGKSTLINGLKQKFGFYQTIHFSKPEKLDAYKNADSGQLKAYQQESFRNSMILANSGARLIYDRWHLGEAVYSNLYRGYDGSYVFDMEMIYNMSDNKNISLILLTEDFSKSKHFKDDGLSFDITKRFEEQQMFIESFNRSSIKNKRIICVTANDGMFKPKEVILQEATE